MPRSDGLPPPMLGGSSQGIPIRNDLKEHAEATISRSEGANAASATALLGSSLKSAHSFRSYGSVGSHQFGENGINDADSDSDGEKSSKIRAIGLEPGMLEVSQRHTELVVRPLVSTPTMQRVFSRVEPGSLRGSIFTLSSSAIGAGLLSLPLLMKNAGMMLGFTLIVIGAVLALFSLNMLLDTADVILTLRRHGGGSKMGRSIGYSELVTETLGESAGIILEVMLVLYSFGTIIGYLLVIGKTVESTCNIFEIHLPYPDQSPLILASLASLPLALFQDISSLAMSSLLSIFAMTFVCMAVAYRGLERGSFTNLPSPIARYGQGFWSSVTIVFFAFNCHTNIFSIYSSLKYPLLTRMKKVTLRSVVLEVVLYSAVAVSGYILFKSGTKGNILENFPVSDGLVTTCKGAVGLTLILNLPLCMHPMRENFFAMISRLFYSNAASKRRSENTLNSNAYDIDIYDQDGIYDDNDDAKIIATPPLSYQSTPKLRGMGTPKLGTSPARRRNNKNNNIEAGERGEEGGIAFDDDLQAAAAAATDMDGGGGGGGGGVSSQRTAAAAAAAAREHQQRRQFMPNPSPQMHVIATLIFMGGALYLGLNVPGVDTVFSFLGATACLGTSFVFPILMYLTVIDRKLKRESEAVRFRCKLGCWFLLIVLVAIGILSVVDSAIKISNQSKG